MGCLASPGRRRGVVGDPFWSVLCGEGLVTLDTFGTSPASRTDRGFRVELTPGFLANTSVLYHMPIGGPLVVTWSVKRFRWSLRRSEVNGQFTYINLTSLLP